MIDHLAFEVQPWGVTESRLPLEVLAQTESVFALSNGHLGLRGTLDEGDPHGVPGSYLNSLFELRPLPYAEAGYGYPESGQSIVNVTNGTIIRLLVDDQPFDVRYGSLTAHTRSLDVRDGVLRRSARWTSPSGARVRVHSERLVSLTQRAVAAIRYRVEPEDAGVRVVLQSELLANEDMPATPHDPRAAASLVAPLEAVRHAGHDLMVELVHTTRRSRLQVVARMDHTVQGPAGVVTSAEVGPDVGRVVVEATLAPGEHLELVKLLGYGWSAERSAAAVADQVAAALLTGWATGFDGLVAEQAEYLADFWRRADVEVDGDAAVQQAVRFAMFHVLQAAARAEGRAIGAKGLTGPGYDGHCFWDTETFVLPLLTYTAPAAAEAALRWRHSTLPLARARAEQLHLAGAEFPWRTIRGEECSAYWPAGTAAVHVNADIADAVARYVHASADSDFDAGPGLELLVETARLWRSLGHRDRRGGFRIDGVTGPDEYSALMDNNVFTNLMAQRNLLEAADAVGRHPDAAATLGVDSEEVAAWRDAAAAVVVPYDEVLGVHPAAEGYTDLAVWDFEASRDAYPLLLHFPYFGLYRHQVVKQADLVLALHLRGDAFSAEQKVRDFAYYEALTVRDSSLSASTQSVIAAEVGLLDLAHTYLREASRMDLEDLEHNTRDGLHMASLAGSWNALVAGLGGLRDHDGTMSFRPALPTGITRLSFNLTVRGSLLQVSVDHQAATYLVRSGHPLEVWHDGERLSLQAGSAQTRPLLPRPAPETPHQPAGREPSA